MRFEKVILTFSGPNREVEMLFSGGHRTVLIKSFCVFSWTKKERKKWLEGTRAQDETRVGGLAFALWVWAKFCQAGAKCPGGCFLFLEFPGHFLTGAESIFWMFLEVLEAAALHLGQGLSVNEWTWETNFCRLRKIMEKIKTPIFRFVKSCIWNPVTKQASSDLLNFLRSSLVYLATVIKPRFRFSEYERDINRTLRLFPHFYLEH